jgi:hypothetical protein
MQTLKQDFALLDLAELKLLLMQNGLELVEQEERLLPAGKALWLGAFAYRALDTTRSVDRASGL